MNEFSLKEGKIRGGLFAAIGAAVKYVVVPLIIFTLILSFFSALNSLDENLGLTMIGDMRNAALIIGIPIIFLAFFRGFYPKGSISRVTFAILTTAMVCIWIWFVMRGGKFQMSATVAELNLDISLLILVFIFVAALGGMYYVAEIFSYRKEYLTKRGAPPQAPGQGPAAEQASSPQTSAEQGQTERPASPGETSETKKQPPESSNA